jgi:hypothetical protein
MVWLMASRIKKGRPGMGSDQNHKAVIRLWLFLALVCSTALLALSHAFLHGGFWGDFVLRVLEAVSISSVIGLVLEEMLLREFGRDVFLASVGYVLPKRLRPEMRWLCNLSEMCTQDTMICTLTPIGDSVIFHFHRKQVVKNIGHNEINLKLGLGIDQWFRAEKGSRIIRYSYVSETQSGLHTQAKKSNFGLNLLEDPFVSLEKDKEVTITSEFEEVYPRNGYWFMHIKYATSGLRITVNCPEDSGLGVYVEFANREGGKAQSVGNDYVCPFTLLPYQRVAVRFWDKQQSADWTAN